MALAQAQQVVKTSAACCNPPVLWGLRQQVRFSPHAWQHFRPAAHLPKRLNASKSKGARCSATDVEQLVVTAGQKPEADTDSGGSGGLKCYTSVRSAHATAHGATVLRPEATDGDTGGEHHNQIVSNNQGMQLTFLGSGIDPLSCHRAMSCIALRTTRSGMLFDVGEDGQRQLLAQPHVRPGRIERIFITCTEGDHMFGLPGMLCTISSAREKGHANADMPLHIYGARGVAQYVHRLLRLSDTYLEMPVLFHEFVTEAVPAEPHAEDEEWQPVLAPINERACLWATALPPDQLNPQGYYNGELRPVLARQSHRRKRWRPLRDDRSGARDLPLPPPGGDSREDVSVWGMTWTVRCDEEYMVTAAPLRHDSTPSFSYTVTEADRSGTFDVERAKHLKIPPGAAYAALKRGESVPSTDGTLIRPEQVVGPDRPGRRIVVLGDTPEPTLPADVADHADVIVAGVSFKGEPTTTAAAALAQESGAQALLLTRFDESAAAGATGAHECVTTARQAFGSNRVAAAFDFMVLNVERKEAPPFPEELDEASGNGVAVEDIDGAVQNGTSKLRAAMQEGYSQEDGSLLQVAANQLLPTGRVSK